MDNEVGRFISVDPLLLKLNKNVIYDKLYSEQYSIDDDFNNLLTTLRIEGGNITDSDLKNASFSYFLANPQQLNSYAYVTNNPIIYTDPTGEAVIRAQVFSGISHVVVTGGAKAVVIVAAVAAAPETGGVSALPVPYIFGSLVVDVVGGIREITEAFNDRPFEYTNLEDNIIESIVPEDKVDRAKGINSIYDQSRHVIQGDALNVLGDVIDNTLQKDEDK